MNRFQDGNQIGHRADLAIGEKQQCILKFADLAITVSDEIGRAIAAIEGHAFCDFKLSSERLGLLNSDHTVKTHPVHGLCHHAAHLLITARTHSGNLANRITADGLTALIQARDHSSHCFFHPAAQFDRAGASSRITKPLLNHRLGKHGGRCGAIASFVLGLSRHLLDQLGSNIFERICKFNFFGDRVTVIDDVGRAIGLLEHHVATFGSNRDPNGVSKGIHAALKGLT